ncbi:MAG TPA: cupin [Spirochaetota bacterium]|nr:cupin [Spirochaetota bacterium]HPJ42639.1 cupin [Spirochaetota bacterium]HPR37246.1 cupin [Spirochaetota bacterium]HRX47430.1 cupin [Spirochaetota bacterium]
MKYLKNIKPYEAVNISLMINHTGNKIASKALIDSDNTEIRFFSFAEGESIDKEYYVMETLFFVIEGTAKIRYGEDDEFILKQGEMAAVESGIDYGVQALTDVKLFTVLVKS